MSHYRCVRSLKLVPEKTLSELSTHCAISVSRYKGRVLRIYRAKSLRTTHLFIWFCAHYVSNLEYNKYYQNAAMFFQEFVFELPELVRSKEKKARLLNCSNGTSPNSNTEPSEPNVPAVMHTCSSAHNVFNFCNCPSQMSLP